MDVENGHSGQSQSPGKSSWRAASSRLKPVPLDRIQVKGFLGQRIEANVKSLLAGLNSPMPEAFEALARGEAPAERGGSRLSDLFKWLEGAACALAYSSDAGLEAEVARIADLIRRAMPALSRNPAYGNLYVAGHFLQAALAHDMATRDSGLLDLACEWADRLLERDRGERTGAAYHPCIEMGLILLSRKTERKQYLDFAASLIERHGVGETVGGLRIGENARHAVCVAYLLTGLAELALDRGDDGILERLNGLWEEMVSTRLYLAGGIGYGEHIPEFPYDLPQVMRPDERKDIAETCASIGLMMLAWRLHGATAQSRIFDVVETTLYNHFLGALSLDHMGIFYYNPLRLVGTHPKKDLNRDAYRRTALPELHRTSCCFPNVWRFLAALPQYIASADEKGIYLNLYTSCSLEHRLGDGTPISLAVESDYPHKGAVRLTVSPSQPASFTLHLRIPSWVARSTVTISGESPEEVSGGSYLALERVWQPGTSITLELDMPVRALLSRPEIAANRGQIAFARGPLIYCVEQTDSEIPIEELCVSARIEDVMKAIRTEWRPDLLGGVHVLHVPMVRAPRPPGDMGSPYFDASAQDADPGSIGAGPAHISMVPYYARANRSGQSRWTTLIPLAVA